MPLKNGAWAEPTNDDRAEWARAALAAFASETGQDTSGDLEHEPATVIGDLLADLMHYCNLRRIDFEKCLANGKGNYDFEVNDESENE